MIRQGLQGTTEPKGLGLAAAHLVPALACGNLDRAHVENMWQGSALRLISVRLKRHSVACGLRTCVHSIPCPSNLLHAPWWYSIGSCISQQHLPRAKAPMSRRSQSPVLAKNPQVRTAMNFAGSLILWIVNVRLSQGWISVKQSNNQRQLKWSSAS